MLFLVTSFQFKFHKNKKILNVCYCAKFFLSTKVCRCQGLIYRVLVLKLLCSRYIVLHVWLTCQGVHKYIDHNPDKIVWNTFWRSISFSECSKKKFSWYFLVKVEIFLEQREVAFLSPSKICKNLNFSREIQIFKNFAGW